MEALENSIWFQCGDVWVRIPYNQRKQKWIKSKQRFCFVICGGFYGLNVDKRNIMKDVIFKSNPRQIITHILSINYNYEKKTYEIILKHF